MLAQSVGATPDGFDCAVQRHDGADYTTCEIIMDQVIADGAELRLFLRGPLGKIHGNFFPLEDALRDEDKTLVFAANAGMYHPDRSPVGHYIEAGEEVMRVIPNAGPGNFGMLPNGVFCIQGQTAQVYETLAYRDAGVNCDFATQSGPMLVIDGALHPRFLPDSTSHFIRNGVGTSADGNRVVFVMSDNPVTFYEFASFFRDVLDLPNALYFDGNVSRMYAPVIGRADRGRPMGPIVGLIADAPN